VHHAGLLPRYRRLVETLAQASLLKVICGTDTPGRRDQRAEGLVLRYLADAYKALRQTVPDEAKTDELLDLTGWLGGLVRRTDSSPLDEWERLRDPLPGEDGAGGQEAGRAGEQAGERAGITGNRRAFRALVRSALLRRVELAALGRYAEFGALDGDSGWDAEAWAAAVEPYFEMQDEIGTGPDARGSALLPLHRRPAGPSAARELG
jgi:hypothetical protein